DHDIFFYGKQVHDHKHVHRKQIEQHDDFHGVEVHYDNEHEHEQNDDKHIQFVRFQDNEHDVFFFDIQVHNDHNDHGIKQSKRQRSTDATTQCEYDIYDFPKGGHPKSD